MTHVVVSDIHLGNDQCRVAAFGRFLDGLPPGATLILNGDVIDRRKRALPVAHQRILERLRDEASRRPVVWVRGNHDETYVMADPGAIAFHESYAIGQRLLVTHGHDFDNVMPYHRPFLWCFRVLHRLRVKLGAESVHVAHYAKRFHLLYELLCRSIRMNAVAHAKKLGFAAVTCGHTHGPEDTLVDGVRYLNTGAWTEPEPRVVWVDATAITLQIVRADVPPGA